MNPSEKIWALVAETRQLVAAVVITPPVNEAMIIESFALLTTAGMTPEDVALVIALCVGNATPDNWMDLAIPF